VLAVLVLAGATQAVAKMPRFHHALATSRVLRDARANRVLVVLKTQHGGRLATAASVRARVSLQSRERRALIARVSASGGAITRRYTTLNAFAATVSGSTQATLAADPRVAAVIPDAMVTLPAQTNAPSPGAGSAPSPGNPSSPLSTVCPSDPAKPLLEPEALQTMHAAYMDPTTPQAQNLATGRGVKVAFFADGLDINNPDFIRADGSHVFIDYRDFTAEGPDAPSGAAEAFGDASSIAAQGRQVYDLSNFVNPAHPLPPGCNITVRGVAPGASLIGMKVFGNASSAYGSTIIQGMDWAVSHDHADIISESFGGYSIPDTAQDMIRRFNDAAVAAGVTVSQGSGDSGATASPSPPATDPLVLNAGANTNFRAYAQTASYAFQFSGGTYLSDNISSIGGGGFGQDAQTVDLVAPGEADWALCSPNPALYEECTDFKANPGAGAPASLQQFGGTSQSTPLTAGAAALVIEAYRSTHQGHTPAPALVKRILTSTANDLGFPAREQGAGEVDALKAVQAAVSVDGGTPTGHGLLLNPAKVTIVGRAGTSGDETVQVTNTGDTTQTVNAHGRALTTQVSDVRQDVTLGTSPTFIDQFGSARPYTKTTFTVPAGVDRLLESNAWPGPDARVGVTLIDPNGSYAAYTRPQGNGNHGQVDVRNPVAGTWTAIVFLRDGTFTGPVHLEFSTQRFGGVDSVAPSSLTLRPGESGRLRLHVNLSASPGDSDHDLVIASSSGDQTVVPVILRSLVPVDGHGASFSGVLTGGNGRPGPSEEQTFAFDVPRGRPSLSTAFTFDDDIGTEVQGFLVDPDGNMVSSQSTGYAAPDGLVLTNGLRAVTVDPRPGRWKFIMLEVNPVGGNTLSAAFHGRVSFDPPAITAKGVPNGGKLAAGTPVTARLTIRNDGPGTEDVFADPRLGGESLLPVLPISQATNIPLPIPGDLPAPTFVVPTQTDTVLGGADASAPILLEMGFGVFGEGDPDLLGQSAGNRAAAAYSAREVANGPWFLAPALRGPFDGPSQGTANVGLLAHTAVFDHATASSTGDLWQQTVDDGQEPSDYTPLTLQPGQSGKITVTFTPHGRRGAKVQGVLYVDDFSFETLTGNEQLAIPYSYRVR
jgi:subtilisin family serine protease